MKLGMNVMHLDLFFSQRVIYYWNALPQTAIDAKSINKFKSQLKIHLNNIIRGLHKPLAFSLFPTPLLNWRVDTVNTITVALDMSKAFDTINIHTLIRKLLQTNIPGTIFKFIANYIKGCKASQHIKITHPNNVNLKLAFHRVASFHPHYLAFTPQTYHHPVHRFRS